LFLDLRPVYERLSLLEKLYQIVLKVGEIDFILSTILEIDRHKIKLIKVLEPSQVIIGLDGIVLP
jgi:hypothetical protein